MRHGLALGFTKTEHPVSHDDTQPREQPQAESASEPGIGSFVKHYELISQLGRGGMGTVYLARDRRLGRDVAIKFFSRDGQHRSDDFLAEARATARCSHENIVVVHEVDEYEGWHYMVLEYVRGQSLREWLNGRTLETGVGISIEDTPICTPVPPLRVVELMKPVVRALIHAHDMGLVHRDLKPENIMLTDPGTIKVVDFGIATLMADSHDVRVIGTMPYMSPEQWLGGDIDHRSDIWAVGTMLYELAIGRHPLAPLSRARLKKVLDLDVPMPSAVELHPQLGKLAPIIDRCLLKKKDDRTASARELLAELEHLQPRAQTLRLHEDQSPYTGLAAFQESDAKLFHGRTQEIARALNRLSEQSLVTIIGPSGAGKSSFVRAGVIPTLKQSGEGWEAFVVRPGRHPLAALAGLVFQMSSFNTTLNIDPVLESDDDRETLTGKLAQEPGYLGAYLRARARKKLRRILIFIDQFEELYTLGASAEDRAAFTSCLTASIDDVVPSVRVVVSLRSDFLDRVAENLEFMNELTRGLIFLPPLGRQGLRDALVRPLDAADYEFENETIIQQMLDALEHTQGALPLLQFTAAKLWECRDRVHRKLTAGSYERIGGVAGTLATHADAVLASMSTEDQRLTRGVFERLVTSERTRAIASMSDLLDISSDPNAVKAVVHRLSHARLLAVETGGEQEGTSVELIHESLISSWPTFARWLDEGDEDTLFLSRIRTAARQWDTDGRPKGLLWRDEAVIGARRWRRHHQGELAPLERNFLDAVFHLDDGTRWRRRAIWSSVIVFLLVIAGAMTSMALMEARANKQAEQSAVLAKYEAERANEQAAIAKREAEVARAASNFLTEMIAKADPRQGVKSDLKVRELLDEGVKLADTSLGDQLPLRAALQFTMGVAYMRLALYDEASTQLQSALAIRQKVYGSKHVEIAKTLDALAELSINRDENDEAERFALESMNMYMALRPHDDEAVIKSMETLASINYLQGYYDRALDLYLRSRAGVWRNQQATGQRKGELNLKLGVTYNALGRSEEALELLDEAERLFLTSVSREHPALDDVYANRAFVLHHAGYLDRAEKEYRLVLEREQTRLGANHPFVGISMTNLADVLNDRGEYVQAEPFARNALEIVEAKQPKGSFRIQVARSVLGESLAGQERFDDAEPLIVNSFKTLQEIMPNQRSIYFTDALQRVVKLYEDSRHPDAADSYRELQKQLGVHE